MEEFFSNGLLYEKIIILQNYEENKYYYDAQHFAEQTFEYFCEAEQKNTTFEVGLEYNHKYTYPQLPTDVFNGDFLDYTFQAICTCKSCKIQKVYFLINVTSDKPISDLVQEDSLIRTEKSNIFNIDTNILAQKVGVYPQFKINVNKQVNNFFCREVSTYYYKGVKAINDNYGIGALAYFRRIIEKELLNLVEQIKLLPDANKSMIQKLIDDHNKNPNLSTIYTSIFEYLPNSLKILGDNPIKLLYNQTSEGLHSLTENESIDKAKNILALLEFVILKINEEKSIVKNIKEIMKELKS